MDTYRRRTKKGSITLVRKGKTKNQPEYNPYLIAAGVGLLGASALVARNGVKQYGKEVDKAYTTAVKEVRDNTDNFIASRTLNLQNSFKNLGI